MDLSYIFSECRILSSSFFPDISNWKTDNVKYMNHMFKNCKLLSSLPDISKWNTSNVINMSDMFYECNSLKSLPDISKWNKYKTNNMEYTPYRCESFVNLPNVSKWNVSSCKKMNYTLHFSRSLKSLPDISKWFNDKKISDLFNSIELEHQIYKMGKEQEKKQKSQNLDYFIKDKEYEFYHNTKKFSLTKIKEILNDELIINIGQDSEICTIQNNSRSVQVEDLIYLKNQILLETEKFEETIDFKEKKYSSRNIFVFFKSIISKLEIIINEYMKILRIKGNYLPIKINIKVKMLNEEFFLYNRVSCFKNIRIFLENVKYTYISNLDLLYKENSYLRFFFGKQFIYIMKFFEMNFNVDSLFRYILNNTDNNKSIKEGEKCLIFDTVDYEKCYHQFYDTSFQNISNYISNLFINNNESFNERYFEIEKYSQHIYRGIYLHKCKNISMEEFIVYLYLDKLSELPIAQNILITNKETSCEEMQAFFYRAILCRYNSLFVVEINDSFTIYQLSKMCFYIHKLLSYKYCEYNKDNYVNILKNSDEYYMNSCLVFVYEENYKYLPNFLKEIINYNVYYFEKNEITKLIEKNKNYLLSKLGNIKLISSDVSGLGKSQKIKKIIKDNKKNYFYFPLGGNLTKNNIFSKLENLLNIIKNFNYQDIAIHLDLTESKEYELINEFFFAFLITKFYIHSENILYIPKDIYIYIEIPNCFES